MRNFSRGTISMSSACYGPGERLRTADADELLDQRHVHVDDGGIQGHAEP
jgi:hypothetical protein